MSAGHYLKTLRENRVSGLTATYVVAGNDSPSSVKMIADYGCDGTDDQIEIQEAIDALPSSGGLIHIDGTFSVSGSIDFYDVSNICLSGRMGSSALVSTDDSAIIQIGHRTTGHPSTDITIRDIKIDGSACTADLNNVTTPDGCGIAIEYAGTTRIRVEGCEIYNTGNDGIAGHSCGDVVITNNVIRNVRGHYGGIHPHEGEHRFNITNNIITGCTAAGIRHGYIIDSNYIYDCGTVADWIPAIFGSDRSYVISNNIVENARHSAIRTWGGADAKSCVVNSNVIENAAAYGIMIDNAAGIDPTGTVSNNIIDGGCTEAGIMGYRDYTTISGNMLSNLTMGISIQDAKNCIIIGNHVYNAAADGIVLTRATHCGITGNAIIDCAKNAWIPSIGLLTSSDYNLVSGNYIDGSAGYGVSGSSSDYNTVENNKFVDVVGAEIYDIGTHDVVRNNHGFTTENNGTATIASASTSIVVSHGLGVTPAAGDIVVTPIEVWGNMTQFYIDTYTATQFTIHADVAPGADTDFAWAAIVL